MRSIHSKSRSQPYSLTSSLANGRGIGSIAAIAAIAGISIVFVIVFLISSSPSTSQKKAQDTATANQPPDTTASNSQPTVIRIPDGYQVYSDNTYKFSFSYPQPWGVISKTTSSDNALLATQSLPFADYSFGSSYLNGYLLASVYAKDIIKVSIGVNGSYVAPTKIGSTYAWKVVAASPVDSTLKVGASYNVKSAKYQAGITIYDFTETIKNTTKARWVFESGDNFVSISLPLISGLNGTAPTSADLATYKIIANNMAKTMRPTN